MVSLERTRNFDPRTRKVTEFNEKLELYDMRDEEEVQVYCRSDWRIKREAAIVERRRSRFEEQIKKLVVNI